MADKVEKSDFDFQKLIWDGAKSLGGSAATSAAEWGAAWALNKVGIQVGFEKENAEKQELQDELVAINDELACIEQNLTQISNEINELANELRDLSGQIPINIDEGNLSTYTGDIDAVWTNLRNVVSAGAKGHTPVQSDLDGIENGSGPVGNALTQIVDILSDNPPSAPLLDLWVDMVISKTYEPVDPNATHTIWYAPAFYQAYLYIERNFMNTVHSLFKGYAYMLNYNLVAAAKNTDIPLSVQNLKKPLTSDQESDIETILKAQIQAGNTYASGTMSVQLKKICDYYVYSIHRLVLSQYRRYDDQGFIDYQAEVSTTTRKGKPIPSYDEVIEIILRRAELIRGLVTGQEQVLTLEDNTKVSSLGVALTSYNKPSELKNGDGPTVSPGGSMSPSSGTVLSKPSAATSPWYQVIDFLGDGTVASFNDSGIEIIEYHWPDAAITVGENVGTNEPFSNLKATYYNKFSLEPVSNPTSEEMQNVVLFAHTNTRTSIENAGILALENVVWEFQSSSDTNGFTATDTQNSGSTSPYASIEAKLSINGYNVPKDDTTYQTTGSLSFAFAEAGTQPAKQLLIGLNGHFSGSINSQKTSITASVPMGTAGSLDMKNGSNSISQVTYGTYEHESGKNYTLPQTNLPAIVPTPNNCNILPGDEIKISLQVNQTAEAYSGAGVHGDGSATTGDAMFMVYSVTIAWPNPHT